MSSKVWMKLQGVKVLVAGQYLMHTGVNFVSFRKADAASWST